MKPIKNKHHELIAQYAEFASWHPEPWKYLEVRRGQGDWSTCFETPIWNPVCEYRWIVQTDVLSYNTRLMYYEQFHEQCRECNNPTIFWKFFDISTKRWLQCTLMPCFSGTVLYKPVNSADLEVQVLELFKANGHVWCSLGDTLETAIKNQHRVVHKVARIDVGGAHTVYVSESGWRASYAIPVDVKNKVIDNAESSSKQYT